jgi:subtilisin family serine protease
MGRRITLLSTWLIVALILAASPLATLAEPAQPQSPFIPIPQGLPPSAEAASGGQVAALIELAEPPAVAGAESPAARTQRVLAAQAPVMQALANSGVQVLYQVTLAANGIAVAIPQDQLARLRQIPGVARVSLIQPKQPALAAAGAADSPSPATLAALAATGEGVRIGVIDRGVDYTHADFGGPGTPAAYAANNPTMREADTFPTAKVVEGVDLSGDDYDAAGVYGKVAPTPDTDPLECNKTKPGTTNPFLGQGTHVAGLAAGYGVAADGTTYRGPYGPGTDYGALRIPPGVAPGAQLFALKIFGCQGSSVLLTAALERAIDPNADGDPADHLDVVVVTLGGRFGTADDPDVRAVESAVRAGVVVVVAAGDNFGTFYSIYTPASARTSIAVGATSGAGEVASFSPRGPLRGNMGFKPDLLAPGVAVQSAAVGTGSGAATLSGTAMAAPQVAGAAALLRELHPTWAPAQIKSALMNSAAPVAAPPSIAGAGKLNLAGLSATNLLAYGSTGDVGLAFGAPWVAASTTATRTLLLENTGPNNQIVTLSSTAVATETGVTVNLPPGQIVVPAHGTAQVVVRMAIDSTGLPFTPDPATALTQPPDNLPRHYLAEHGGYIKVNSVGTPGTRVRPGHAAHLESVDFYLDDVLLDDSLDSREVQEYVDTTPGTHTVYLRREHSSPDSPVLFSAPVNLLDGKDYTLLVIGRPGALDILAVDDTVSAPPAAGQALIHYVNAHRVEPNWNICPLVVYLDGVLQVAGLPVGATSAYFPIAPGQHTVSFYKAGEDPALERFKARRTFVVAAGEAVLAGTGRHDDDDGELSDDEQRAFVGIAPIRVGGALLASVPFNIFPTLASDAHADRPVTVAPTSRAFGVGLRNTGARNAGVVNGAATPRTPLASAFELEARSPALTPLSASRRPADLQYLGVTSNYSATGSLATTLVYFGLSSYAPWSTPSEVLFDIYIDANRDGVDDYLLRNTNWGTVNERAPTDVFASVLYPLRADGSLGSPKNAAFLGGFSAPIDSSVNVSPFNTSVMIQVANLRDLALPLDPANPGGPKGPVPASFCYRVLTRARDQGAFTPVIDRVPAATAPAAPACASRPGQLLYTVTNYAIAPINTTMLPFAARGFERPIFADVEGGRITGGFNPAGFAARGGAEMLVFHHHNTPYPRAEVVPVAVGPVPAQ